jgi:hypothetical protein
MKPLDNLSECLDALKWEADCKDELDIDLARLKAIYTRIHELTRWNNINDSLPPKGALFETCGVESGTYWRYYTAPPSPAVDALYVPEEV